MAERRISNRVSRSVRIKIKEYIRGRTRTYRMKNVSSSGLFIKTRRHHTVGETLLVHYPIPGSRDTVRLEAEVARVVDGRATVDRGVGIRFLRAIDRQI